MFVQDLSGRPASTATPPPGLVDELDGTPTGSASTGGTAGALPTPTSRGPIDGLEAGPGSIDIIRQLAGPPRGRRSGRPEHPHAANVVQALRNTAWETLRTAGPSSAGLRAAEAAKILAALLAGRRATSSTARSPPRPDRARARATDLLERATRPPAPAADPADDAARPADPGPGDLVRRRPAPSTTRYADLGPVEQGSLAVDGDGLAELVDAAQRSPTATGRRIDVTWRVRP